ncbi:MAG TPA: FAD-dependent oxidoreductase, partial [Anaerolineae bacterium]|nr:FAD-dependent oxidoreductase [Anaerolineae bacterium]
PAAYLYGLPRELYDKYRIRRYGFHGTSHRFVASRALELLKRHPDNTNFITVHLGNGASITAIEAGRGALRARLQGPQGEVIVEADKALLATGRRPNVAGLGLEAAGVRYDRRGIQVNEHMATSVPGIYAVGDVTGGSMLAHVAMHQGAVAAESSLGHKARMRYDAVPSCIFARPEAASVGLTEQAAREQGYDVRVGRFPFNGNGKAIAQGEVDGFIKVVAEARYGALLGLHIVGAHASDLVLEGALGLTLEMTLDELAATIHPHPSLGEALAEAGLAALGRPLHLPKS